MATKGEPYDPAKSGAYPATTPYYRRRSSWVWAIFAIIVVALLIWWLWPTTETVSPTAPATVPPAAVAPPPPAGVAPPPAAPAPAPAPAQ